MRAILLMLAVLWTTPALAAQPADEAAIRELVRSYVNARDLQNQAAVGDMFTADADQHTTAGEWRRGRPQIMTGTLQSSTRNPGARRITVRTVRFITPDTAIVDGPYELISPDGQTRSMWATLVVTREGGAWRIAAIRNAIPTGAVGRPAG